MQNKKQSAYALIMAKLLVMINDGTITDQYDIDFLNNISRSLQKNYPLSFKQDEYLYELFNEKY